MALQHVEVLPPYSGSQRVAYEGLTDSSSGKVI